MQIAARLPKPLSTLFEKLKVFAASYQQFKITVKVRGAQTKEGLDQDAIDDCYIASGDAQLMYNLANQARASVPVKDSGDQAKKRTRMPGVSDYSKRIKKEKKRIKVPNL